MRSLPECFHTKVIAIEEACDLEKIIVNELIGSLRTYEVGMKGHKTESKKSVAFKANIDSHDVDADQDECEDLIDSFALLTRKKFGGSSKKENFRKTYKSDGTPSSDVKERSNK